MGTKVYYNNSCNICRMEINHYKKIANTDLEWIDITNNEDAVKITSKTQKELLTVERKAVRDNIKGAISRAASIEGYIRNCEYYLKHGDWCDDFYGEYQEKRVRWKKVV